MSDNLHDLATQIIGKVIDLPNNEALLVIEQSCKNNQELHDMVMDLYTSIAEEDEIQEAKKTSQKEVSAQKDTSQKPASTFIINTVNKRFFTKQFNQYLIIGASILVFFILTLSIRGFVNSQLVKNERSKQLAQLEANVKVFNQWLQIEQIRINALTQEDSLVLLTKNLYRSRNLSDEEQKTFENTTNSFLTRLKEKEKFTFITLVHGNSPQFMAFSHKLNNIEDLSHARQTIGPNTYPYYLKAKKSDYPIFIPPLNNAQDAFSILSSFNDPYCAVAGTIRDENNTIIGILAVGYDAKKDFSNLFNLNNYGKTAYSYAFNRKGNMISETRFISDLQNTALLDFDTTKTGIFNIELRNPEVNLLKGKQAKKGIFEQELTEIVKNSFTQIESSIPMYSGSLEQPYLDYRGIKVYGSWSWIKEHDFGIIAEQEAREVRTSVRFFNYLLLLFAIIILLSGLLIYRSNLQLYKASKKLEDYKELGQYQLLDKLGEGGFGDVYKAQHSFLKTPVAIKLLKKEFVGTDILDRFKKEVKVTSSLSHPNTITLMDYGTDNNNRFYYVMEFLDGISLERVVEMEKQIPINRLIHILLGVSLSLQEAHNKGIMHRDVKPANIMLCNLGGATDFVKLLDFGLVKELDNEDQIHTKINRIGGTPMFMAPERLRNPLGSDYRVDIYALGAVGLYMLSGQYLMELVSKNMLSGHETLSGDFKKMLIKRKDVPKALNELLLKCIHFNPDKRPSNIEELIVELESLQKEYPWDRKAANDWWKEHQLI